MIATFGMSNIITTPTRVTNLSRTNIDHIITNVKSLFKDYGTILTDISHHYATFGLIQPYNLYYTNNNDPTETSGHSREILDRINLETDLSHQTWQHVYNSSDPNEAYSFFLNKLIQIKKKANTKVISFLKKT
jgi:hypothetical protein